MKKDDPISMWSFQNERAEEDDLTPKMRLWVSRLVVLLMLGLIGGFGMFAFIKSLSPPAQSQEIISPFRALDGVWEGELATYKWSGEEVDRQRSFREYHHVLADKEFRQEGHFEIIDPATGKKSLESLVNIVDLDFKSFRRRSLMGPSRNAIDYAGQLQPEGFFWSRSDAGGLQSFHEWVEGDSFFIEGFGIYGDRAQAEPLIYIGRFKRITNRSQAASSPEDQSTAAPAAEAGQTPKESPNP